MFINSNLIAYITQWDFQNKKYVHNEGIVQNIVVENILLLFRVQEVRDQISSRVSFIVLGC
jgi:hypothetical protein